MTVLNFRQLSVSLLAAAAANASPVAKRAVIAHDAVVGFAETVPSDTTGAVYEAYQPFLKVVNGCVPFPAVDASGNTSGGLSPTGSSSSGCSSSTGQIYVRSGTSNGRFGVMYSWYFPKDSPSSGLGHRHDWEGVIVWLSSSTGTSGSNILAVCPSAHGDFPCTTSFSLSGTGPLIKYESVWPVNHALGTTSTVGGQQPLIAWESLTDAARTALENTDFGEATPPFRSSVFASNLASATF